MYILFRPPLKKTLTYQVSVKTLDNSPNIEKSTLTYNCSLRLKKETLKGYIVNIKRSDVLLNNTRDQSPINEILLIAGEILYNLDLEISEYGKVIKIHNFNEILQKWEDIKFKIESTYKGKVVQEIIDSINKKIQFEKTVIESLDKDPFFFYVFNGVYENYTNNECLFSGLLYGLSDIPLSITKNNKLLINKDKTIHLVYQIIANQEEIETWKTRLAGDRGDNGVLDVIINGQYILSEDKSIESIMAHQEAYWDSQLFKAIEVNIQLTE